MEKLPKNIGTAIGLELRDNTQALSATNSKKIKAGMTFNVALGRCSCRERVSLPGGIPCLLSGCKISMATLPCTCII